jgi:hypothetical protein
MTSHAAALAQVIRNSGSNEYCKPELFFTTPSPFLPSSMDQEMKMTGLSTRPAAGVWRRAAI